MRRVDGVLPSEVLSAKCHVAWTRSGRLVFSKLGTYTILVLYLVALVQIAAIALLAAPKTRVRAARVCSWTASMLCKRVAIDAPRVRL